MSRTGTGGAAGKTADDPDEPLATLSLSNDREPQWAVRPLNQEGIATNWGQETPLETWWHLPVVNDGRHTTLYVEGCPVVRNPKAAAVGISSVGLPWLHSVYSHDAKYTFSQRARAAARYGLDWVVFTEHSNVGLAGDRVGVGAHSLIQDQAPGAGMRHPGESPGGHLRAGEFHPPVQVHVRDHGPECRHTVVCRQSATGSGPPGR